jgi:hypothetical protein
VSDWTRPDPELLQKAVFDPRWRALARVGTGLRVLDTWDPRLSRRTRLLVPVDVQAFVVPAGDAEPTVPVTGGPGDPPPFAVGSPRPAGVHLHWAMPDALLRGREQVQGSGVLALPRLPDRWVVVRTVLPEGQKRALVRGWVIEPATTAVTPLATWSGVPAPAPDGALVLDRVDGTSGGGLLWTASYSASAGRFGFHDDLSDLAGLGEVAPRGLHRGLGTYTVAGWWQDEAHDPLAGIAGRARLDAELARLGWHLPGEAPDEVRTAEHPLEKRLLERSGFRSPAQTAPVEVRTRDRVERYDEGQVRPTAAVPVARTGRVVVGPAPPTYATLLHGAVVGVPVDGVLPTADDRPADGAVTAAAGLDVDDVVAALGARGLGLPDDQRRAAEQLTAAFTGQLLERLGTPDGLTDLLEREHGDGFWSLPGPELPLSTPDRLRESDGASLGPTTVGRKGRAATAARRPGGRTLAGLSTSITWTAGVRGLAPRSPMAPTAPRAEEVVRAAGAEQGREVVRAAPRRFRPQPPLVALRGAKPHARHHGDGLFDDAGRLRIRFPGECVPGYEGVASGCDVVPTLGSGAVPDEVLRVVQEAVVLDPYGFRWLAAAGAPDAQVLPAVTARLAAEAVRLYGTAGRYDPSGSRLLDAGATGGPRAPRDAWSGVSSASALVAGQVAAEISRFSVLAGAPPSPVALTTWRQPWVPLWLEWRVTVIGGTTLTGWRLGDVDLEPAGASAADRPGGDADDDVEIELVGRSVLSRSVGTALHAALSGWLETEQARVRARAATLSGSDAEALQRLADFLAPVDVSSASLDGVREQLLGIRYVGHVARPRRADGSVALPEADRPPLPLVGGRLRIDALRLVDAFGRTRDVPVASVSTTTTLEVPGDPAAVALRPRLQHGARWLFRLVDPGAPADTDPRSVREAFVDQVEPRLAVNPVAGFLLPDHVDESLEAFTVHGDPLGELVEDAVTGGVRWEPAPGRPLPPDAGPLAGTTPQDRLVGEVAAGLVRADAAARARGGPAVSALSALLRVVDTTLWTVDTFSCLGTPSVAGLVGRPIAVVRAMLTLDVPDDLDEVEVTAAGGAQERRAAFDAVRQQRFPVRLGELARSDDALLGFFVDDDYLHLHVVDKAVADLAVVSGRHRGHLGLLGRTAAPGNEVLRSDYLVLEDTLLVQPGRPVRLTLLMLPAGRVHLTSGVLPRKALALADDWVTPGLRHLVPSLRVGPVLVDPAQVRLPKPHLLGEDQTFTRRTGPLSWRDDPIVAATQTAHLPRLPHEVQEGWIRVSPEPDGAAP